jgi:hypothetical protein
MDELEQLIGGQKAAPVITDKLLDSLRRVESGKDPLAVNKQTKAMGPYQFLPETVQMLHRQGVKFNPFDEQESRNAARTYLEQLVNQQGSVEKALAAYGGFVTKDPSAYVQNVMQGQAPQAAVPQAAPADDLESLIAGTAAPAARPTPAKRPVMEQLRDISSLRAPVEAIQTPQQVTDVIRNVAAVPAGALETGLTALSGALAAPIGAVGGIYETLTGGKFGTPEGIRQGQQRAAQIQEALTYRPSTAVGQQLTEQFGKALEATKVPPVAVPEVMGMAPLARGAQQQTAAAIAQARQAARTAQPQVMTPQAVQQMQQQFAARQVPSQQMPGMGAAMTAPVNIIRGNIDAAVAQASPELQTFIKGQKPEAVNLAALETRALEEKHGINLTRGQRTGDTALYSTEWNRRGETPILGEHFGEQPKQFKAAFESAMQRYAPDIFETEPSAIGQTQINALAAKDQLRRNAISEAYKKLQDANAGQFPIDVGALDANIKQNLSKNLTTSHLSSAIASDLAEFYKNPTFEAYEALRTNLANEMRSSSNGNARAAAYIVRDELEKMPVFGENTASPQAAQLKRLADDARRLVVERANVIKSNPAYRAAVKEAADVDQAAALGESLNAEKFHEKFVTKGTPEGIRRMKAELADSPEALQSLVAGELRQAMKKAGVASDVPDLNPKTFANYIRDNKGRLQEALGPQAMQDLMELAALSSKIGMPKTGTFNYSNTFSGMLGEMAKQGLSTAAEAKLAGMTGGASIPALSLTRQFMQKMNKEGFAKEAVNPYGGLTKEK